MLIWHLFIENEIHVILQCELDNRNIFVDNKEDLREYWKMFYPLLIMKYLI